MMMMTTTAVTSSRQAISVLMTCFVCLATNLVFAQPFSKSDEVSVEAKTGEVISRVVVENPLGDVRVIGHSLPFIKVRIIKRAKDKQTLERLRVTVAPSIGSGMSSSMAEPVVVRSELVASPQGKASLARGSVDLVLWVPYKAHPTIRVRRGKVTVSKLSSGVDIHTVDGRIDVSQMLGPVRAQSISGMHNVLDVIGDVWLRGVTSHARMEEVTASEVVAQLHSGNIYAKNIRGSSVALGTVRGMIQFFGGLRPGAKVRLQSVTGAIRVVVNSDTPFDVIARDNKRQVRMPDRIHPRKWEGATIGHWDGNGTSANLSPAVVEIGTQHGQIQFSLASN